MADTGYDGGHVPRRDEPAIYRLTRFSMTLGGWIMAQILRNDEPVGLLRFDSQTEFDWFQSLIDGKEYDPEWKI